MYTIKANHKEYVVSEHALMRMQQRDISEQWVINTLENGDITTRPQGTDVYEYQIDDDEYKVIDETTGDDQ